MNLSNTNDAELALIVRHRQTLLKKATEDLALALAEQEGRKNGTASYEAPEMFVAMYPQRNCACCGVPSPVDTPYCAPCVKDHGEKLAPRKDGNTTCARALAADAGAFERIDALPSVIAAGRCQSCAHGEDAHDAGWECCEAGCNCGQFLARRHPSKETLAAVALLEVDPLARSY